MGKALIPVKDNLRIHQKKWQESRKKAYAPYGAALSICETASIMAIIPIDMSENGQLDKIKRLTACVTVGHGGGKSFSGLSMSAPPAKVFRGFFSEFGTATAHSMPASHPIAYCHSWVGFAAARPRAARARRARTARKAWAREAANSEGRPGRRQLQDVAGLLQKGIVRGGDDAG